MQTKAKKSPGCWQWPPKGNPHRKLLMSQEHRRWLGPKSGELRKQLKYKTQWQFIWCHSDCRKHKGRFHIAVEYGKNSWELNKIQAGENSPMITSKKIYRKIEIWLAWWCITHYVQKTGPLKMLLLCQPVNKSSFVLFVLQIQAEARRRSCTVDMHSA